MVTALSGVSGAPTVSVCISAYNAQDTILETLESVWCQTFAYFEVVVVDDCSTDGTAEILASQRDPRLRVFRNPRNLGAPSSSNRALRAARGRLIKFLDHDDTLREDCLARMVVLADSDPGVGMVFCRRNVWLVDASEHTRRWKEKYDDVSAQFGTLRAVNDGRELFASWVSGGLQENWIGEPAVVMLRREILERSGGFNPHVRQQFDSDLWARVMPLCAVGFIPDALATYRKGKSTLSTYNHSRSLDWLDRMWILEGLDCLPEVAATPGLAELREEEWRWIRHQLPELLRVTVPGWRTRLGDARQLAGYRIRKRIQPGAVPFGRLGPASPHADASKAPTGCEATVSAVSAR
jgi:GT2 family glycosyltransferase